VIPEAILVYVKDPLGESLAVLQQKQIFVLSASEDGDDALYLLLVLLLAHFFLELIVSVNGKKLFDGDNCFSPVESLFDSCFVIVFEIPDGADCLQNDD
jgi:hypothetical protein